MTGSSGASWGVSAEGTPSLPPPIPLHYTEREEGAAPYSPGQTALLYGEGGVACIWPSPQVSCFSKRGGNTSQIPASFS